MLEMDQLGFTSLFDFELSTVPTSLFKVTRKPYFTSSEAILKNKIQVEVSSPGIVNDAILIDEGDSFFYSLTKISFGRRPSKRNWTVHN